MGNFKTVVLRPRFTARSAKVQDVEHETPKGSRIVLSKRKVCLDIQIHLPPQAESEASLNNMPEPNLCLRDINAYMVEEIPGPSREKPVDLHVVEHGLQAMLQHQERSVAVHMQGPPFVLAAEPVPGVQWQ